MKTSLASISMICLALAVPAKSGAGEGAALPHGAHYVAMGSSYAAGPGITTAVVDSPARCARSKDNYAQQLARRRGFSLTDVSCSGATTAHVLGPWNELPAQLDALRTDTRLVTVTIGGNDLAYMGGLVGASCRAVNVSPGASTCPSGRVPTDADYAKVREALRQIAAQVKQRSPLAQLVFVDYATVLPARGVCALTPMTTVEAQSSRAIAARLAKITGQVAQQSGAQVLRASAVTREHHVCAREPWMNGYTAPGPNAPRAPYHPTLAGMTAVAAALDKALR
jgi:lysophospholipase L1-like esterase